jgi:hypothetical protein
MNTITTTFFLILMATSFAEGKAGTKAGSEAGTKAGSEAGTKAGTKAGSEAGTKAGSEAGTKAGSEAGTKAGTKAEAPKAKAPKAETSKAELMKKEILKTTTEDDCKIIVVVAPKPTSWWQKLTSNKDLSMSTISDLGAGGKLNYEPIADEVGFAVGVFGTDPMFTLREHGKLGKRNLFSGNLDKFKTSAKEKGYSVTVTKSPSCSFQWRHATAQEKHRLMMLAE